jgi:rhamnogalacturonan endolyase
MRPIKNAIVRRMGALASVTVMNLSLSALPCQAADLFKDDFSNFPPGWLSSPVGSLNAAIQEYHYLPHRGVPLGPWANAICHLDAWLIGDEEGHPYLEQHSVNSLFFKLMNPTFLTGDAEWSDYTVEAKVKPLSLDEMAGIVFRYHTNRHYYLFSLTEGKRARLALRLPLERIFRVAEWRELGSIDFPYDTKKYYHLKVVNEGPRIQAFIDDHKVLEASDNEIIKGKVGLTANIPARFQDFRVQVSESDKRQIEQRIQLRENELAKLRADNPKPKVWKKFNTPKFGAGRNVRFGDLDGDGRLDMLIAQNIPRVRGDAFDHISCLTAVTFDGKVLWQSGRPDPRNGFLTNDTPFQVHDIDGDGQNEVVLVQDFKLQVREGKTGKVRHYSWMPPIPTDSAERPYELNNGDSLAFFNLSGKRGPQEILVKDRYKNFWVFNNRLELLWKGQGQTGHFPYPFDADGDGRDEILIGYSLWDHTGRQLWSRDAELKDHADGIAMGNFSDDPRAEPKVYASGSDEGFLLFDKKGNILKHVRAGHTQSPSIGKYRLDLPGLQYMTINFWRNPGIVSLFDYEGNLLLQEEPIHTGSPLLPVNWRGDGQEFAMLSGNVREGGMLDGYLRRAVMFPDDGHPDLAFYVADVMGDSRDEIILWDQERVWIYTQDRPFTGNRIYAPLRNPHYNESNYLTTVSLPGWREK